mgnify:CR=1 FL=1
MKKWEPTEENIKHLEQRLKQQERFQGREKTIAEVVHLLYKNLPGGSLSSLFLLLDDVKTAILDVTTL